MELVNVKNINKAATAVMNKLVEGLSMTNSHKKINNSSAFMPVTIERIGDISGNRCFSVAHYYEQNGDLMRDPEVTFVQIDDRFVPLTFTQDNLGIYRESVVYESGVFKGYYPKEQSSLTSFSNMWMKNIGCQQGITA